MLQFPRGPQFFESFAFAQFQPLVQVWTVAELKKYWAKFVVDSLIAAGFVAFVAATTVVVLEGLAGAAA